VEGDLSAIATWIGKDDALSVLDEASVSVVRDRVRGEGARIGLDPVALAQLVNVASELAHNQLVHATGGFIVVREALRVNGQRGLEVVAADRGAGIANPTAALSGRRSMKSGAPVEASGGGGARSLGVGLAAVCELTDELDIDVRLGEGTCIWARKFGGPKVRARRVGVFGRPYPGEGRSGDDAAFVRTPAGLCLSVADGLGHGDEARRASIRAVRTVKDTPGSDPQALLILCHKALAGTRGAVMAVGRVDDAGELEMGLTGNVSAHVYGPEVTRRLAGPSFVLGAAGPTPRVLVEKLKLGPREMLVLFSDGIRTRMDLTGERDLLHEHPVIVAQAVIERFGREDDDALVLVAS
jgi:anti-sigma regulatory factor (Ser/Thr protein kinase)